MKNFKTIIIVICLLHNLNAIALNYSSQSRISNEIKVASRKADIGIKIKNLKTGKIIYQQNEDRYYNFGSSLKMISIFSLLRYFGSNYLFAGRLFEKNNSYYLDINDPDFSNKDLEILIAKLKELSSSNVDNFYIVNSKFTTPDQVEGRMIEDGSYCYGSPVTKIHINKNCIRLKARPSTELKKPIYLKAKEVVPYKIINKTYTIPAEDWPKIKMSIEENKLIISGTLNKQSEEITIGAVVNDSQAHLENMVKEVLSKYNIILKGQVLPSSLPEDANLILSIGKTFNQLGSKALKMSDNFISDYMLAEFGSRYAAKDWRNCGNLLKQLVFTEFNVDLSKATIADASGLSRYNMLTVNQFDEFLFAIYNSQDFIKLLPMLAQADEESSLKERFKGIRIFAKTGGMTGISSIVGYVFDKNNIIYSFVIVSNNYFGNKKEIKELQEAIINYIVSD